MARHCDHMVFDADNHLYETQDALTKHLPDRYKGAIDYVEVRGRTKIVVKGQISEYIPNPTFDVVARPGAQEEYFRNGNPEGKSYREIIGEPMKCIPAFREPAPRLELMDELGVDRSLMFPTLASLVEERMRDDPETTHVVIHALNEWLHETWTFNYEDRIFTTPVITLPIVEKAIEELEWCIERGAKSVLIRPAPVPGFRGSRSFGLPEFDPFWQAVVDADILVSMHASDSGYTRYQSDWTGPQEMLPFRLDPFRFMLAKKRPIMDSMTAFTCHGVFTRFPELRVAAIENGGDWVIPLLHDLADVHKKMPQAFPEDPVAAFKRCVWISPFHEDDIGALIDTLGADHILFGSDYPHPEGLAEPCSYLDHLPPGLDDDVVAGIMGRNLADIMRVSVRSELVATAAVLDSLALEAVGPNRYRGGHAEMGHGVVFGGQLLGQSLIAAAAGHDGKLPKTVHTVFARGASPEAPLDIEVDPVHAGRAFASSTVTISQGDRVCTRSLVLLTAEEPDFIRHAEDAPALAPPADADADGEWQVRTVGDVDISDPDAVGPAELDVWTRFDGAPGDPLLDQALLAFATDGFLIGTAMRPHDGVGQSQAHKTLSTGVITHTLTFHEPVRAGAWMLLRHRSPYAGHGRSYGRADVFGDDGALVASFVQDAMIRPMAPGGSTGRL